MKTGKPHPYLNGEPYIYKSNTVKAHECCDCGLLHFIHVDQIKKGKCVTYWYRDSYQTNRIRKKNIKQILKWFKRQKKLLREEKNARKL